MYSSDSYSNSNVFGGQFPPQHQAILEHQLVVLQVMSSASDSKPRTDKSEVPGTLSLDSINLLMQFTEHRKPV